MEVAIYIAFALFVLLIIVGAAAVGAWYFLSQPVMDAAQEQEFLKEQEETCGCEQYDPCQESDRASTPAPVEKA
ncbi:MAG: hypothetical protein FJ303_05150 [Planctomycetes bacterium]|nr:hypothetical protein [Planctomycetota bacterium]